MRVLPTGGSKIQALLLSREISGAGMIKGISWKPSGTAVAATYDNLTVSLGNYNFNFMTNTFVTTVTAPTFTQVRTAAPYTVLAGDTGFIPIPLDMPFLYTGSQNLVVEITTMSGDFANPLDAMSIAPETRFLWSSSPGALSGSLLDMGEIANMISLRLEFE